MHRGVVQEDFERRERKSSVEGLDAEVVRGFVQLEVGRKIPAFRDGFVLGVEYSLPERTQAL
jgi:hypothetical protein